MKKPEKQTTEVKEEQKNWSDNMTNPWKLNRIIRIANRVRVCISIPVQPVLFLCFRLFFSISFETMHFRFNINISITRRPLSLTLARVLNLILNVQQHSKQFFLQTLLQYKNVNFVCSHFFQYWLKFNRQSNWRLHIFSTTKYKLTNVDPNHKTFKSCPLSNIVWIR